ASLVWAFVVFGAALARGQNFDEQVRPFFAKHCQECHGGEKVKGDFRIDKLSADFADKANRDRWLALNEQLKAGTMPPKGKPRPAEQDVKKLSDWIVGKIETVDAARRATEGRVVLRRLNRNEYQNTVRDLLGVTIDLLELLPEDSAANGFDNVGSA